MSITNSRRGAEVSALGRPGQSSWLGGARYNLRAEEGTGR
jgi:hypothetical protein